MRALFFSVDMTSSSNKLHFFTTEKCLDGDLLDDFCAGAAYGRSP